MTRHSLAGTACVLGLSLLVASAQAKTPTDYVRLIPASPAFPKVAPVGSPKVGVIRHLLPAFIDYLQDEAVAREFITQATEGLLKAKSEGANGVLLRITKVEVWFGTIRTENVWGSGIETFATGMNVTDACITGRCWEGRRRLPTGYAYTADSDFLWAEFKPSPGAPDTVEVSRYLGGRGGLASQAQHIVNDAHLSEIQKKESWSRRLEGYVAHIAGAAEKETDRQQALALLANRQRALAAVDQIEANLAREREKARKAASALKVYETLSTVLSLAANVAIVSGMVGEDISATSKSGVADALRTTEEKSATRSRGYEEALKRFLEDARTAEQGIYKMNITVINSAPGTVVVPPLN